MKPVCNSTALWAPAARATSRGLAPPAPYVFYELFEALLEAVDDGGEKLQQDTLDVRRGVLDEDADGLEGADAEVGFRRVLAVDHLEQGLEELRHVGAEGVGSRRRRGVVVPERRCEVVNAKARLGGHPGRLAEELARQPVHQGGEGLLGDAPHVQIANLGKGADGRNAE